MNNKSVGYYVGRAIKKGNRYFRHHFSKFFVFWILGITNVLSKILFPLAPIFQRHVYNLSKMIYDSDEAIISKSFDNTDKSSFRKNLFLFDVVWFLITLVGIAVILGVGLGTREIILNIDFFYWNSYGGATPDLEKNTLFLLIPFAVLAAVFLFYSVNIHQIGVHVANKNTSLNLGDIMFNAFLMMKQNGWKLFALNLLFVLQFLGLVVLIAAAILIDYLIFGGATEDFFLFLWIMIPIFSIIIFFFLPSLLISWHLASYSFLDDFTPSDRMVVAVKKEDVEEEEADSFIQMIPYQDKGGSQEINLSELAKKEKKEKDEEKKDK